ncbi:P-loop containing nucleoside triphosphate hydrolase protein, partial [Cladochytrium replicatum]
MGQSAANDVTPATRDHQVVIPKKATLRAEDALVDLAVRHQEAKIDVATALFEPQIDFSYLKLKPDHASRPLWVVADGRIILEAFSPVAHQAQDFLITIAEPVSRPSRIHEYKLTPYSLYAAVSVGLETEAILDVLNRLSKVAVPDQITKFIRDCTISYGKIKLVLKHNRYFIESSYPEILRILLQDPLIQSAQLIRTEDELAELEKANRSQPQSINNKRISELKSTTAISSSGESTPKSESGAPAASGATEDPDFGAVITVDRDDEDEDNDLMDESDFVQSFEIQKSMVEDVRRRCGELDYPLMEEYDFRHDDVNANLGIDLQPRTTIRDYQEKSLSKMFGNGRARSGIIVLPTGAGKTLVGITAACTVKKSTLVLCTNAISVDQWANEFRNWSTVREGQIAKFTADHKSKFVGDAGIVISTYTMIAHSGRRAADTARMLEFINSTEWGLLLLDEVHVVPANVFRRVLTTVAAHAKLGLTATLVREDDKILDLNFLIGPKLYEANWMDLAHRGHIAKVEATEVWCPMTGDFYKEYLKAGPSKKRLLCVMNPNKYMACEYLIRWRESENDKIIVFSDNVFALRHYAMTLQRPFIYGQTSIDERQAVLRAFREGKDARFRTIFLSKVGDTSLDLPEATCLIQISSQFGSRRQEAQRMGRILRAKRRNEEGFKSRFYTLVSRDTDEMFYSAKRKRFLVDQGYEFKVIKSLDDLVPPEKQHTLKLFDRSTHRKLLEEVKLADDETALGLDVVTTKEDDLAGVFFQREKAQLANGFGASAKKGAKGKAGGGRGKEKEPPKKENPLFKMRKKGL